MKNSLKFVTIKRNPVMLYGDNVNKGIKCPEAVSDTNALKCKLLSLVT